MKHIVIGTAGHIDHGKTTLIKALTGRDTDTLKEEKERGISINLGFTYFDLPSGRRAGIIDVPGHEKFIKNMLAGVSSIDVVILVIAADEGIMPQTREHLEILQLLNVKKGIIALTKIDLVDEEWISMMTEEIREELKDTFLEGSPIYPISSKTGEGLQVIIKYLDEITGSVEAKDSEGHFRLPVDRVFSVSGFGTVVTGTIISGRIKVGETVEVYPEGIATKVRGLQVHEKEVDYAEAGQRCAMNLSNIKTEQLHRGDVISREKVMDSAMIIDCKLHYLKGNDRPLVTRQRVRLYHGTAEVLCRVVLLDREELKPGEEAYVQLRLEAPITAQRGDRYVIRSYSPMVTIGGGTIVEPSAQKAKQKKQEYIESLRIKESGDTDDILEKTIETLSKDYPGINEVTKALGKNEENIEAKIDSLCERKKVIKLTSGEKSVFIHMKFLKEKMEQAEKFLKAYHINNPLKIGISKEEFKNRIFGKNIKQKNYDELLEILKDKCVVKTQGHFISEFNFSVQYTKEQEAIRKRILAAFDEAGYFSPKVEELAAHEKDKKSFKMVFDSMVESEVLVKVAEDVFFIKEKYNEAVEKIVAFIEARSCITAAETRDLLNTSRKFAVSLLEHLDQRKETKRNGDVRVLYKL